ncbi:MAG: sensor histidine kinase [Caulobacteraceae bacterium]|nr:sensor histidine kinase [Caulobacteraceae bacterium]
MEAMRPPPSTADSPPSGGRSPAPVLAVLAATIGLLLIAALAIWSYGQMAVRQGAAALAAQGADLASRAAAHWPGVEDGVSGAPPANSTDSGLESQTVLPPRPAPAASLYPPDIDAVLAGARLAEALGETKPYPASLVMLDQRGLVAMGPGRGGDLSSLPQVRSALAGRSVSVLRRNGVGRIIDRAQPILVGGRVAGVLLLSRGAGEVGLGVLGLAAGAVLLVGLGLAALVWRRRTGGVSYVIEPHQAQSGTAATQPIQGADPRPPLRHIAQALSQPGFVVSPYVTGDLPDVTMSALALETVLAALIETSRKAGASRVDILADLKDDSVRMTLADDGADVRAADRHLVFQPLFGSGQAEGVRGGLPIARSLIEAHGGELSILDPESGAAFQLRLPTVRAA